MAVKAEDIDIVVKAATVSNIRSNPSYVLSEDGHKDMDFNCSVIDKRKVIEAVLNRFPLPRIICTVDSQGTLYLEKDRYLHIIKSFMTDSFEFKGESFDVISNYTNLPRNLQRRIEETEIPLVIVRASCTPEGQQFVRNLYRAF